MSQKICRETYANYGSYLRSRGTDKAVCDLIDRIEAGNIALGPFIPFIPPDTNTAVIDSSLHVAGGVKLTGITSSSILTHKVSKDTSRKGTRHLLCGDRTK